MRIGVRELAAAVLLGVLAPAACGAPGTPVRPAAVGATAPAVASALDELRQLDPQRRAVAALRLGALGAAAAPAVPDLIALLANPRHRQAKVKIEGEPVINDLGTAVTRALEGIGSVAVAPLVAAVEGMDARGRLLAVLVIGRVGGKPALPALLAWGREGRDVSLRIPAVLALAHIPDREAIAFLVESLGDREMEVRRLAVISLETTAPDSIPGLAAALGHRGFLVRANAAYALSEIFGVERVKNMLTANRFPDTAERLQAIAGHRDAHRDDLAAVLGPVLRDHFWRARRNAAEALGALGPAAGSAEHLRRALGDADPEVRAAAAKALGRIGAAEAAPAVAALLDDSDPPVRVAAATALGALRYNPAAGRIAALLLAEMDPGRADAATLALGAMGDAAVPALLSAFAAAQEETARTRLIAALGRTKSPQAVPALRAALAGGVVGEARKAAEGLGGIEGEEAGAALLAAAAHADPEVRRSVAAGLGRIGDDEAVGALVRLLGDTDKMVGGAAQGRLEGQGAAVTEALLAALPGMEETAQWRTARVLGKSGDPRAVPALFELAARSDWIREAAEDSLKEIGRPSLELVAEKLRNENVEVRRRAARAMAQLVEIEGAGAVLLDALRDVDKEVRYQVIWAMCRKGSETFVDGLATALRTESDHNIRRSAAQALGATGSARALDPLIAALADDAVCSAAAAALGALGDPRAVGPLAALLGPRGRDAGIAVAVALARIGEPAVPALLERARSGEKHALELALRGIKQVGSRASILPLVSIARAAPPEQRREVVDALGQLGDPRAVPGLLELLKDPDPYVVSAAAGVLGGLGDPAAIGPLLALLSRQEVSVRLAAISSLGFLGARQAVVPLTGLLRQPERDVRRFAAGALQNIAVLEPDAVPAGVFFGLLADADLRGNAAFALGTVAKQLDRPRVLALLGSQDPFERRTGADLLKHHRSPEVAAALAAALSDKDLEVRRAAAGSLALVDDCFFGSCPSLEPLIEALGADDGELRRKAENALGALTRRRLGAEPERWRAALPRLRPALQ